MTNKLTVFNNEAFGQIRTMIIDDEPWFVGKDIAEALGYAKPENALAAHVDDSDKTTTLIQGDGSNYKSKTTIINESGLYALIFGSKLPTAKEFKHWVTSEVLPSIRKHGMYAMDELLENPDIAIQAFTALKEERTKRKALEAKVEQDKPKVLFADAVDTAKTTILIGDLAKLLKQNNIEMGQHRLFTWLRQNGYLIKRKGSDYNMPTQYAMELGLFEIRERTINNPDGSIRITKTPKVTGKGQQYFVSKFLGDLRVAE